MSETPLFSASNIYRQVEGPQLPYDAVFCSFCGVFVGQNGVGNLGHAIRWCYVANSKDLWAESIVCTKKECAGVAVLLNEKNGWTMRNFLRTSEWFQQGETA